MFRIVNARDDLRALLEKLFKKHLTKDMIVYDIGCGDKPFKLDVKQHVGVDLDHGFYDSSHLDILADAYNVPVEDGVADAVISSQFLEHLERPEDAIKEIRRLLKDDGLFFISVPFLAPIHAAPHDFTRMTEFQLQRHLKDNGFDILSMERLSGFWYVAGVFTGLYLQPINRGILKRTKIGGAFLWFVRWVFYLLHSLEGFILKTAKRDAESIRRTWTVNYVILAQKK